MTSLVGGRRLDEGANQSLAFNFDKTQEWMQDIRNDRGVKARETSNELWGACTLRQIVEFLGSTFWD